MGNKKGVPRHRTRYSGEQDRIVYHPKYGVMKYKSGWLSIPDKNFNIGEAEVVDYKETMRVKGKTEIPGLKKQSTVCERCGKKVRESMIIDGLCEVCFRAIENEIEEELKKLRSHWRNGGMQLRTGSSLETGSNYFKSANR